MTHPTREDWMSYLYDELTAARRAPLATHLQSCAECRAQMAVWQTAGRELSAWKIPDQTRAPRRRPILQWAAAAALAALALVGATRLFSLSQEVQSLRAELQRHAGAEGSAAKAAQAEAQRLIAEAAQQWEQKRAADQQAVLAGWQKLSAQQAQNYATLRKELETVAVFSEAGLQRAQNQISSLAQTPATFTDQP